MNFQKQLVAVVAAGVEGVHLAWSGTVWLYSLLVVLDVESCNEQQRNRWHRSLLELGGKSLVLYIKMQDRRCSKKNLFWVSLFNAGQTCVAPDLYVMCILFFQWKKSYWGHATWITERIVKNLWRIENYVRNCKRWAFQFIGKRLMLEFLTQKKWSSRNCWNV